MAYGAILGQTPTASNVAYNNSQTSSIITGNNVQQAIDQLFTSVSNGKSLIAGAITDKGVSTSANDTFQQMATNIESIQISKSFFGTGVCKYIGDMRETPFTIIYSDIGLTFIPDILFIKFNPSTAIRGGTIVDIFLNSIDNFYYSFGEDFYSNNLTVTKTDGEISFQIIANYAGRTLQAGNYDIQAYKI